MFTITALSAAIPPVTQEHNIHFIPDSLSSWQSSISRTLTRFVNCFSPACPPFSVYWPLLDYCKGVSAALISVSPAHISAHHTSVLQLCVFHGKPNAWLPPGMQGFSLSCQPSILSMISTLHILYPIIRPNRIIPGL